MTIIKVAEGIVKVLGDDGRLDRCQHVRLQREHDGDMGLEVHTWHGDCPDHGSNQDMSHCPPGQEFAVLWMSPELARELAADLLREAGDK